MGKISTGVCSGVWAASLTPMDGQLNIDRERYIEHIRWLLGNGCNGVALFGTTGEANSFSIAEKISALESVAKTGIDMDKLMVGTGCCAVNDTISFTKTAIGLGYTNFLILPPFYYKGVSEQGIFNAYAQLIAALPPTGINIIIYDIPQMSGVEISLELLIRLRNSFPDIIKGVKNSAGDWTAIKATCEAMPDFSAFAGTEQYLLATLQAGGAGCISATANVTSQKLGEIYAAHTTPKAATPKAATPKAATPKAANLQSIATKTRLMLQKFPPAPALKQILARSSGSNDWKNIRPPLVNLSSRDEKNLLQTLEKSGLALNEAVVMEIAE